MSADTDDILAAALATLPGLDPNQRTVVHEQAKLLHGIARERREIEQAVAAETHRNEQAQHALSLRMGELRRACPHPKSMQTHFSGCQYDSASAECRLCGAEVTDRKEKAK